MLPYAKRNEVEELKNKYDNEDIKKAIDNIVNHKNLKTYDAKSRVEAVEKKIEIAQELYKRRGTFGRAERDFGQNYGQFIADKIEEDTYYKSSILRNIETAKGKTFFEKYNDAEKITYEDRTDEFMKKFGKEKIKFNGKTKMLKTWLKNYKEGKISKDEMNSIIEDFKDTNEEYLSEDYKGQNTESNEEYKKQYFE